jgi:hypothetical protein
MIPHPLVQSANNAPRRITDSFSAPRRAAALRLTPPSEETQEQRHNAAGLQLHARPLLVLPWAASPRIIVRRNRLSTLAVGSI